MFGSVLIELSGVEEWLVAWCCVVVVEERKRKSRFRKEDRSEIVSIREVRVEERWGQNM